LIAAMIAGSSATSTRTGGGPASAASNATSSADIIGIGREF
jgi:hypothetical protein